MLILSQLGTRLTAWIGSLNVEVFIERSPVAREHAFMLRKAKINAEHLMAPDEGESGFRIEFECWHCLGKIA